MRAIHFVVAVVALVVGIGLGGLGPRSQVRALEKQLEEAQECSQGTMGTEIANVFRGRPWEEGQLERKVTRFEPDETYEVKDGRVTDADGEEHDTREPGFEIQIGSDDEEGADPEAFEDKMAMARDAMELRYAQARAALEEDANPSDAQLEEIDTSMKQMNDELIGLAEDLVDTMNEDGEPNRRDAMLFAAETLDVLLSAEDSLRNTLDDDQIAGLQDESLDPMSYVDPAIIDVLEQLNVENR